MARTPDHIDTHTETHTGAGLLQPQAQVHEPPTFFALSLYLLNATSLKATNLSKCHWESKAGGFFLPPPT